MTLAAIDQTLLPAGIPAPLVWLGAVVVAGVWYRSHGSLRLEGGPWWRAGLFVAARFLIGAAALLLILEGIGRLGVFSLVTNLPLWAFCPLGAAGVEGVVLLYRAERSRVSPTAGRLLMALRVVLLLLVILMLAQPVFVEENSRELKRTVAVLLDDSLSMRVPDTHLAPWEKVRLVEALGALPAERPVQLEQVQWVLGELADRVATQAEWLGMAGGLKPEVLVEHLRDRAKDLRTTIADVRGELRVQGDRLSKASETAQSAGDEIRASLKALAEGMEQQVHGPLEAAKDLLSQKPAELARRHTELLQKLQSAATALDALAQQVKGHAREVDAAFYAALPAEQREAVDSMAGMTRLQLARRLLLPQEDGETDEAKAETLLDRVVPQYGLKAYRFAEEATEMRLKRPTEGEGDGEDSPEAPRTLEPGRADSTDFAAAVDRVLRDLPAERLAGIMFLTDGRHNASASAEAAARQAGTAGLRILPVMFGATAPPRDAAVVSLDVPDVVYEKDTVYIGADVKLDGLAGKTATLTLRRTGEEQALATRTIDVVRDRHREKVELSYTPEEAGIQNFEVALNTFEDEVFKDNNRWPLSVRVSEDKTRLLVIEGYPRWEFRYLKNLFANRDQSVKLQYVLFRRDKVGGTQDLPEMPASATREEAQATALPRDEMEWLKFDVIVLGDVPPDQFDAADLDALRRFVEDRGGVLVVVAGPRHMPHDYTGTVLESIVPVRIDRSQKKDVLDVADKGYHIRLSPEGRQSVVMRQSLNPEANLETWRGFPPIYWRHPLVTAKPGARVLGYAVEATDDEEESADAGADNPGHTPALAREAPLVLLQQVSLGRVIMLCFDRTWRLRYRAGDEHHHKFWGQVMRWATAGKLAAGTNLVKLGTDRARYAPGATVTVRARILETDLSPIANAEVAVNVYRGEELTERKVLQYLSDSPGIYECQLEAPRSGSYRAELDAPRARSILASEGAEQVVAEFAVDPAMSPEKVELSPDGALLERLAELSGGDVAAPWEVGRLLELLAPSVYVQEERREYPLWNSWPFLLAIIGVATAEWLLRRRSALP